MLDYSIVLDEPWTFLDARGNPVEGRRLTFELADGGIMIVDVSHANYSNLDLIVSKLEGKIEAHEALKAL